MSMLRERWLLILVSIVLAFVVSAFYFSSSGNPVVSKTTFTNVNRNYLLWSGQHEGETVNIEPDYQEGIRGIQVPPFYRYSLVEGLNKATERLGVVLVPTLLPEGIAYSDVYIGPVVDLCFSYNKTQDPSYADIVIEIGRVSVVPSVDDMRTNLSGFQLVQVEDKWVKIFNNYHYDASTGQSWAFGYFFYGNLQYLVNAKYPLTNQDLTTIIGNMKAPA
jgi:hypothetical protein